MTIKIQRKITEHWPDPVWVGGACRVYDHRGNLIGTYAHERDLPTDGTIPELVIDVARGVIFTNRELATDEFRMDDGRVLTFRLLDDGEAGAFGKEGEVFCDRHGSGYTSRLCRATDVEEDWRDALYRFRDAERAMWRVYFDGIACADHKEDGIVCSFDGAVFTSLFGLSIPPYVKEQMRSVWAENQRTVEWVENPELLKENELIDPEGDKWQLRVRDGVNEWRHETNGTERWSCWRKWNPLGIGWPDMRAKADAYFAKHNPPLAENEVMSDFGNVIQLRWRGSIRQHRRGRPGDFNFYDWIGWRYGQDSDWERKADAWFDAHAPLGPDKFRLDDGTVCEFTFRDDGEADARFQSVFHTERKMVCAISTKGSEIYTNPNPYCRTLRRDPKLRAALLTFRDAERAKWTFEYKDHLRHPESYVQIVFDGSKDRGWWSRNGYCSNPKNRAPSWAIAQAEKVWAENQWTVEMRERGDYGAVAHVLHGQKCAGWYGGEAKNRRSASFTNLPEEQQAKARALWEKSRLAKRVPEKVVFEGRIVGLSADNDLQRQNGWCGELAGFEPGPGRHIEFACGDGTTVRITGRSAQFPDIHSDFRVTIEPLPKAGE